MFQEVRTYETMVNYDGSIVFNWQHAPDEEHALQRPQKINIFISISVILSFQELFTFNR